MGDAAPTERVYIAAAGNIDPERHILAALKALGAIAPVEAVSTFYRTSALGRPDQPDYLNGVVAIRTDKAPRLLKFEVLRKIEADHGRIRTPDKFAARTIDLDILVHGAALIDEEDLKVPDPDLRSRVFLGKALLELAPQITPPGWTIPLAEALDKAAAEALRPDAAYTKYVRERLLP